jgi:hypothetical protein
LDRDGYIGIERAHAGGSGKNLRDKKDGVMCKVGITDYSVGDAF